MSAVEAALDGPSQASQTGLDPLGTAIALQPFGRQAGSASALLGFLQMGSAAIVSTLASAMPFSPSVSLAVVMTAASVGARAAFAPVYRDRPPREAQSSAILEARVSDDA